MGTAFYNQLQDALTQGDELAVTLEQIRQQIAVIEQAHRQHSGITQCAKFVFAGFRHGHILSLYQRVQHDPAANSLPRAKRIPLRQAICSMASSPQWYFEPEKFGGVFNDIAIHALDLLEWTRNHPITSIIGARVWNAQLPQFPHFKECGEMMLAMDDGCGILGDVSYLAPDGGFASPYYWRFTLWGDHGVLETSWNATSLRLHTAASQVTEQPLQPARSYGYLNSFLSDIAGKPDALHTQGILNISRKALHIQERADAAVISANV